MLASPLVLLASARPAGHTAALMHNVLAPVNYMVLDLLGVPLAPYSYTEPYPANDAFGSLIRQVLRHEVLILATPVYWYAMSGLLKTYFDRLTDLVTTEKALGRQLRGKRLFVLASGTEAALPPGFEEPFRRTARYFDMTFGGSLYYSQHYPLPPPEWAAASHAFRARLASTA